MAITNDDFDRLRHELDVKIALGLIAIFNNVIQATLDLPVLDDSSAGRILSAD